MEEKQKPVKVREIKFTELTFEDGSQKLVPTVDDFTDFELIGILKYYTDLFIVKSMKANNV